MYPHALNAALIWPCHAGSGASGSWGLWGGASINQVFSCDWTISCGPQHLGLFVMFLQQFICGAVGCAVLLREAATLQRNIYLNARNRGFPRWSVLFASPVSGFDVLVNQWVWWWVTLCSTSPNLCLRLHSWYKHLQESMNAKNAWNKWKLRSIYIYLYT